MLNNNFFIQLTNVSFRYPKSTNPTINDISLDLYHEFTAIVGPNGSGKTTLGKLITGIFAPTSGEIKVQGKSTRELTLAEIGRKIGYLFQQPDRQLFAPTVIEELAFPLRLKGINSKEVEARVQKQLILFELEHLAHSLPFLLSRGEKQRLLLAAILINKPQFLLLDEPTTGLDVERKAILSRILHKLLEQDIGIVAISHDEAFVERHAQRVIEMRGGVVTDDTR